MRLAKRPVAIGVPVLVALALAIMVLWAWGLAGGSSLNDGGKITGMVEYTVMGADGVIKDHKIIHNATDDVFLNEAASRLSAAATLAEADLFDNIQLCTNVAAGSITAGAATLCVGVDLNGATALLGGNPADTTPTDPAGVGNYQAVNTFTCVEAGGCPAIAAIQLAKGSAADGTVEGIADVGAVQVITVTLADTDTLQITWTVTIS